MVYISALLLGLLGGAISLGLITVFNKMPNTQDERIEMLEHMLPGANCGACGVAGCGDMARAMVSGEKSPSGCPLASENTISAIAELLEVKAEEREPVIAQLVCNGKTSVAPPRAKYSGVQSCVAAHSIAGGPKGCTFGCLGFGDCVEVCPVDAIVMGDDDLPFIDPDLCTGCSLCVDICPRNTLHLIPKTQQALIRCRSEASGRIVRQVCEAGCIQCMICVRKCPQEAIALKDGRIQIDPELCDGCGICAEVCPTDVIDIRLQELFEDGRIPA